MTSVVATIILLIILTTAGWGTRDDTDHPGDRSKRSGLVLYTDYGTGVQYVGTVLGGITPRLDKDGKVMVVKGE